MQRLSIFLFSYFILLSQTHASFVIPKSLNSNDRVKAIEILGFPSQVKLLSSPYPLGGKDGVEVGISSEYIDITELSRLGAKTKSQSELSYTVLSLGKGLYNNMDVFFEFSPFTQTESISHFGGQYRWAFYETKSYPSYFSFILHGSGTNYLNKITTQTMGYDFVSSFFVEDMSFYIALGFTKVIGRFTGGKEGNVDPAAADEGITDNGNTIQQDATSSHSAFGATIHFGKFFVAGQLDRHVYSAYSIKLGSRF